MRYLPVDAGHRTVFRTLRPERESRGQRAIDHLDNRLPEVAAFHGQAPGEFKAQLLNDRPWRLDQRGRMFIVEELAKPSPATPASAVSTSLLDGSVQPLDQVARSGSPDPVLVTAVLITSSTGVCSCSCGGAAHLGMFDDSSEVCKPALVFNNQLGSSNSNEKYLAEATPHEAGRNRGLAHDGTATVLSGTARFTISPAARSASLDTWVGLRDAAGTLLATVKPADALNAIFSVALPAAATDDLSVQGTGKGDPLTPGDSNYGRQQPGGLRLAACDWRFSDATASSGTTAGSTGVSTFNAPATRATSGGVNFKVTGVSQAGHR